jgi:hypothetical protein
VETWQEKLESKGFKTVIFKEPYFGNKVTALAVTGDEDLERMLAHLRLL